MTSMGCLLLAADADDMTIRAALAPLGAGPLHAWLDNPARLDGLCLRDNVMPDEAIDLVRMWPQGRLFTPQGEIRWEHQEHGGVYAVVIADAPLPEAAVDTVALTPLGEPERWLLWGERRAGGWFEERIPYLAERIPETWPGPRAAIHACLYEADKPVLGAAAGPRLVSRYLAFEIAYAPEIDPRFNRDRSEQP